MICFNRIELATYLNKPLDPIDFKEKEALNSSSVRLNRIIKILKKFQKNFEIRSTIFFHIFYSVHFDSIRFKFGSFIVALEMKDKLAL